MIQAENMHLFRLQKWNDLNKDIRNEMKVFENI